MKSIYSFSKYRLMHNRRIEGLTILLMVAALSIASCKKFVDVHAPITSLTGQNVFTNDATAASVLTGIYGLIGSGSVYTGANGISLRSGLSADELTLASGTFFGNNQQLYQNNLSAQIQLSPSYWEDYYQKLLTVNSALEGLNASKALTNAVKNQLLGEAYFLRGFFHFYLVNFYGEVPLSLTSDWRKNAVASRTAKNQVLQHVIEDLKQAQDLLSDKYVKSDALTFYKDGSEERIRPTKWAAAAILARAYLYTGDWANAETQATLVINNNSLYSLNTLAKAFNKNNPEAIWQIQYVNNDRNTEGYHFILSGLPNFLRPTYLSSFLLGAFESGDKRRGEWVGGYSSGSDTFYFPKKYKAQSNPNNSEYLMVLRIAEQYLIRAEARAQQNNLTGAIDDLDKIRQRATLPLVAVTNPAISKSALLDAILHERQVELFTEWGHRWFDLKRTGKIDAVMGTVLPVKRPGFTWNTNWQLYPLLQGDINLNPNLAPNNPGY
ncbi:RagB/SusD family nutrient uptake outer membrane protein [Niastella caeni]|nr:RagB/SusD family nutrient uptake outer membrane protein [Niastella caeni]